MATNSANTPIYDIQGAAHTSPLNGQTVTTCGIVTAVDTNGFYLQDALGDGDITTSDAIFVFTGRTPTVSVGDELDVTGRVSEFTPGGVGTGNLSTTQISGRLTIDVLSSGNALPTATIIGTSGRVPPSVTIDDDAFALYDPVNDGIDFFESLEGMLVTAEDVVAVAGTNRFEEIFAVANQGADATGISDRGTLNISPNDFNPEKIKIDEDSDIFDFAFPQVNAGDRLGDVTGVIGYGFGNFRILPTVDFTPNITAADLQPETTTLVNGNRDLTIASYNVLNLDPNDSDRDTDVADGRFEAIAAQIANNLETPDIIGLQEIQDNSGSTDDGTVSANATLQALVDAIAAAGGPTYSFIDNTFITDDASGGQPGGNARNAFLFNPNRVSLVDGSVQTIASQESNQEDSQETIQEAIQESEQPFNDAPLPLVATFDFNGEAVTVVNNQFSSKGGSAPILGVEQDFAARQEDPTINSGLDERREQAQAVNNFVDGILATDADASVVVLGSLNEFEFVSPLQILAGTAVSANGGQDADVTGDAVLTNLINTLPEDERYSSIFQGNSQTLDHILVSDRLADISEIDIVHVNSEFAATAQRASDHDPVLARISFNQVPTAQNDSGADFTTAEDASFTTASVLANDSDPDNDRLSVTDVNTTDTLGLVVNNNDGTFEYDPDGQFDALETGETASDRFSYTISDGNGGTATATVSITITGVSDAPPPADLPPIPDPDPIPGIPPEQQPANGLRIQGTPNDDCLNGGVGDDVIRGRAGNDKLKGLGGRDRLIGNKGDDLLKGGSGNDTLKGGSGNDRLVGQSGDDLLNGGGGHDRLRGGAGRDELIGGRGNDILIGGIGRDIFVLKMRHGTDLIRDFKIGQDLIRLQGSLSFRDLSFEQQGRNTLIDVRGETLATLRNIQATDLGRASFV